VIQAQAQELQLRGAAPHLNKRKLKKNLLKLHSGRGFDRSPRSVVSLQRRSRACCLKYEVGVIPKVFRNMEMKELGVL
jgi:hypothetical protein